MKFFFSILFSISSIYLYSQHYWNDTLLFSQTGDTVLYNTGANHYTQDSYRVAWFVAKEASAGDSLVILSHWEEVHPWSVDLKYNSVSKDTIARYKLTAKGYKVSDSAVKDLVIHFETRNAVKLDYKSSDQRELSSCEFDVDVKYGQKEIWKRMNQEAMFFSGQESALHQDEVIHVYCWKIGETGKFLFEIEMSRSNVTKSVYGATFERGLTIE